MINTSVGGPSGTVNLLGFDMPACIHEFAIRHFESHRAALNYLLRSGYALDMIYLKELLFGEYDMIRYDDEEKFKRCRSNPTSELVPLLVLRKKAKDNRPRTLGVWVELHIDENSY